MRILHVVMFCCFYGVCAEASAVLEVSGHVGAEVSIHCSGSWTTDNSSEHHNMYFCKGVCSKENILIQTASKRLDVTRHGRYSMEVNGGDGAFSVTIKRLKRTDAGTYHCGVEGTLHGWHQEVALIVADASTVPLGSPPSTTTIQTLPQGSFASGTEPSPAASTRPAADDKTNQTATPYLKDTTVVIIVSISLALLVCAIIPLILYRHLWSNAEDQNKGEAAVRLQSLDAEPESSIHNSSQYAAVYQVLNPTPLD